MKLEKTSVIVGLKENRIEARGKVLIQLDDAVLADSVAAWIQANKLTIGTKIKITIETEPGPANAEDSPVVTIPVELKEKLEIYRSQVIDTLEAISSYHSALMHRENGNVAANKLVTRIEEIFVIIMP